MVGTSTACPGRSFNASTPKCSAAVQEFKATAWRAPTCSANFSSNRFVICPVVNQPDRKQLTTSPISASVMDGRKNGTLLHPTLLGFTDLFMSAPHYQ